MDGIGSSWLTIILVFVIIGGMAFFIMLSTANDVDKTIEASVQQDIDTFVKECSAIGEIPAEKAQALEQKINSYGIRFELKIWVQAQTDSVAKKTTQLNNGTTAATQFITNEYSVDDVNAKGGIDLKQDNVIGVSADSIGGTNEDAVSAKPNKDYSSMHLSSQQTVTVSK